MFFQLELLICYVVCCRYTLPVRTLQDDFMDPEVMAQEDSEVRKLFNMSRYVLALCPLLTSFLLVVNQAGCFCFVSIRGSRRQRKILQEGKQAQCSGFAKSSDLGHQEST